MQPVSAQDGSSLHILCTSLIVSAAQYDARQGRFRVQILLAAVQSPQYSVMSQLYLPHLHARREARRRPHSQPQLGSARAALQKQRRYASAVMN